MQDLEDTKGFTDALVQYNPDQSLGFQAALCSRLFNLSLEYRFREAGIHLTAEQWGTIFLLVRQGRMAQSELCQKLHQERSSVSRLIDGLVKRGLVSRNKTPEDSRKRIIIPTELAVSKVRVCSAIAFQVLDDATEGMTELDIVLYKNLQVKLIRNLKGIAHISERP